MLHVCIFLVVVCQLLSASLASNNGNLFSWFAKSLLFPLCSYSTARCGFLWHHAYRHHDDSTRKRPRHVDFQYQLPTRHRIQQDQGGNILGQRPGHLPHHKRSCRRGVSARSTSHTRSDMQRRQPPPAMWRDILSPRGA
jgi:hypothetical protein